MSGISFSNNDYKNGFVNYLISNNKVDNANKIVINDNNNDGLFTAEDISIQGNPVDIAAELAAYQGSLASPVSNSATVQGLLPTATGPILSTQLTNGPILAGVSNSNGSPQTNGISFVNNAYKNGFINYLTDNNKVDDANKIVINDNNNDGFFTAEDISIHGNPIDIVAELTNFQHSLEIPASAANTVQKELAAENGPVIVEDTNGNGFIEANEIKFGNSVDNETVFTKYALEKAGLTPKEETATIASVSSLTYTIENARNLEKYLNNDAYKGTGLSFSVPAQDKSGDGYINADDIMVLSGNREELDLEADIKSYLLKKANGGNNFEYEGTVGFYHDSKNKITGEAENTGFIKNYFGVPFGDSFRLALSFFLTSNPSSINPLLTQDQIADGVHPGGISLTALEMSFMFDVLTNQGHKISPIGKLGFLTKPQDQWLKTLDSGIYPAFAKDLYESTITDDRLGLGFDVKFSPEIDSNSININTAAGISGGPYFTGGLFNNKNSLSENAGCWLEESLGSLVKWDTPLDWLEVEGSAQYVQENRIYEQDSKRHTYSGSALQEFVATNLVLGGNNPAESWKIGLGCEFLQMWETITNNNAADENVDNPTNPNGDDINEDIPSSIDISGFTHAYSPFVSLQTPNWKDYGQLTLTLGAELRPWNAIELLAGGIVNNKSIKDTGISIDLSWDNPFKTDWLTLGANYSFNKFHFQDASTRALIDSGLITNEDTLAKLENLLAPKENHNFSIFLKASF